MEHEKVEKKTGHNYRVLHFWKKANFLKHPGTVGFNQYNSLMSKCCICSGLLSAAD